MPYGVLLSNVNDFDIGPLSVRPQRRLLEQAGRAVTVEPLVMQVLVALSRRAGLVVSRRELFDLCWGAAPVGDDSLNRVIAVLRKSLRQAAGDAVGVETVQGAGYVLRLRREPHSEDLQDVGEIERTVEAGRESWRRGSPEPDHLCIEQLRQATRSEPTHAAAWGMLALLCRYAAEYAGPQRSADYVTECEKAAERALLLDPSQADALVALATVQPLFGRWMHARTELEKIILIKSDCPAAQHELAIVEMTTGRVSEAKRLIDGLIAGDPLAACFSYKSVWQHWSVGDIGGMDHAADRAIQLWPMHPAVWTARLWTLLHTGRAHAALAMMEQSEARPAIPLPMLQFLQAVGRAAATNVQSDVERAIAASCAIAAKGPAQAVAALLALGLFNAVEELFAVAYSYYIQSGNAPVPVLHTRDELSINDQHRRVTQPLFTPACALMRVDPRFSILCDRIGLAAYWEKYGVQPDFLTCS